MADSIKITTELKDSSWVITATVVPGSNLPKDIFVYENTGSNVLGDYIGVCNLSEFKRLQVWAESPIPLFGNRFVRSDQAKIILSLDADPTITTNIILSTAKNLKTELASAESTSKVYQL